MKTTLQIIEDSNFLQDSDLSFIRSNVATLQENWNKRQKFRTETEMVVSVLNDLKHPTPASKYWQAIREQAVFYSELVGLSFSYRRNEIEIKKVEKRIAEETDELERELLQIDLEEKQFAKINMDGTAKDRIRELKLWDKILNTLDDGSFDTQDVNTHQLESYTKEYEIKAKSVTAATPPGDAANILGLHRTTQRVTSTGIGACNEFKQQIKQDEKPRLTA
jgi:hypothetical protein